MALSSILGLPIMYLFPDAQEKPALALCIVAILPRVIALRNKIKKNNSFGHFVYAPIDMGY